jgi:uncharacterized protein YtpQ (UPF0354 family)
MGWFDALRALFTGGSASRIDPDAFTADMVERVRAAMPGVDVRVSATLSLAVGGEQQMFLDNVFRHAANARDEREREAAIAAWVASMSQASASDSAGIDDVVPVLKAPDWIEAVPNLADGERPVYRTEAVNAHLAIVYAVDTPHSVAYVPESWFVERGIDAEGLRRRAVDNLRGKLPGLEVQRGGGLNMVVAGGYYEASILLFDEFWAREVGRLRGDPVIAIPARDVLVFGDSDDEKAVADLRRHAVDIHADAAYALSPRLFRRYADGRVEPFDE